MLGSAHRLDLALGAYLLGERQEPVDVFGYHGGKGWSRQLLPPQYLGDFLPPFDRDAGKARFLIGFLKTAAALYQPVSVKAIPGACDCKEIGAADRGYFVLDYVAELIDGVWRGREIGCQSHVVGIVQFGVEK